MNLKGRYWTLLWLVLFLGVALTVVGRQREAFATADRLRRLGEDRSALDARRADLEQQIRTATSRAVLVPRAERLLGLQLSDSRNSTTLIVRAAPRAIR